MSDLFQNHAAKSGPVECLGQTFPSDEARREHYLKLLAEKLKDPAFRKVEGFPIGSDEDILALSDPPYYTACPNPFIEDFVRHYGKAYDSSVSYSKEPFAADVSEGKNDPIYNAHSYHTKVPHKAIMRYILHYTQPGDIVFDGFCGTGMTGVAAQLCGDRAVVTSLGYRVEADGTILEPRQEDGKTTWKAFSKIGARHAVLNDLSTAATFIAYNYNTKVDSLDFDAQAKRVLAEVEKKLGWMYETTHTDGVAKGRVNYTVWSDVFTCPECAGEVVFWDAAVDQVGKQILDEFKCPHCSAQITKRSLDRAWTTLFDESIKQTVRQAKQVPVLINYSVGKSRFEKTPDAFDLQLVEKIAAKKVSDWHPSERMMEGGESRRNDPIGMTHVHHFFTQRNLHVISKLMRQVNDEATSPLLKLALLDCFSVLTRMSRFRAPAWFDKSTGPMKGWTAGTLYVPSLQGEQNVFNAFAEKVEMIRRAYKAALQSQCVTTGHNASITMPANSADYVFFDPPFGANINYSELNFLWESWLKVITNNKPEAIENKAHKKSLDDYRHLMTACFAEAYRILKPGRWMTIEFSNTQASVWNAIQIALQEAGFVVANVSALDKKQGSFKAVTTTTAVKQDLVISAYKPNGGLEDRFAKAGGSEDSVWDFVRTHLSYLPTVKVKAGDLEFIAERDPRIIFDRMVAWFVRHNFPVPMSTHEFQAGLTQRFADRDGMVFLADQVAEYDRKRAQVAQAPQMEMFVSDERSAIDWLTDFLKRRPSTYQEVHTDFISQLGAGWKKHESKPELAALLEDNFIQYDGTGEVPSQIHSYLSTNHKDLRGLEKNSPALVAKAKDRWYVPDPNKAQDLEKKREKALLKEFDHYRAFTGRRLKEFRLEALRAGFRAAWGNKDYQTIINIAKKVPDEALQEDEKLLTLYDLALTRTEDGI
ncbi:DNA methylase [Ectopseudomonas mendocina]|uniref:DNA methylase n=1 Tax=Ectopseudomonas mendocina TaxID=300 RepID=A0ABD7RQJ1_ECTME|nr:DNA methyltransferase [Pseudomonas mendocina]TRO09196.1 DNA methylase [Pseudomonas mendocina]TRO11335.1 DNA methylase [Pseudomonas mendocina]TRO25932.1 DNA methylase [Pseudomonas mendocina]